MNEPSNTNEFHSEAEEFVLADPVLRLIYTGRAKNLDEAEEVYLNESLPEFVALAASSATDAEIEKHPLTQLLIRHGMRGLEDSLW